MATRADNFVNLLVGVQNAGSPLATGYVTFSIPGTTTAKNAWEDKDKAVAITKKALDSNGRAEVFGDGEYRLRFYVGDPDAGGVEVTALEVENYKCVAVKGNVRTIATDTEGSVDDWLVLMDTTAGDVVYTLPDAALTSGNGILCIKVATANVATVASPDGQTINNATSIVFGSADGAGVFRSSGVNWYVARETVATIEGISDFVQTMLDDEDGAAFLDTLLASSTTATAKSKMAVPMVGGTAYNLTCRTNATNPTYQIDIDADELLVKNAAGDGILLSTVNLTVDITASGANGLDTGSENNDMWYYGWVIYNPTTATTAGLLSESATAPTLPAGYTYKTLVTAVKNVPVTGDFRPYRQSGFKICYETYDEILVNGASTATSPKATIDVSAALPPIATGRTIQTTHWITSAAGGEGSSALYVGLDQTTFNLWSQVIETQASSKAFNFVTNYVSGAGDIYYYHSNSGSVSSAYATMKIIDFTIPGGGQ